MANNIGESAKDLIQEIALCKEFGKAINGDPTPCCAVVNSQQKLYDELLHKPLESGDYQLPEPWCGNIENAKILFISSNPTIAKKANTAENEPYPTIRNKKINYMGKHNIDLPEFFTDRFNYIPHRSRYLAAICKWSGWILLNKKSDEKPSASELEKIKESIALTEIVHCKSQSQIGVTDKCIGKCTELYLERVLEEYKGNYIVVVGSKARDYFQKNGNGKKLADKLKNIGKRIIYTEAPNARDISDKQRFEKFKSKFNVDD